jgi:hypothetical protein
VGAACGCRKVGFKCSIICANCNGVSCSNIPEILHESEDEDEQIPEISEFLSWQMPDDPDNNNPK